MAENPKAHNQDWKPSGHGHGDPRIGGRAEPNVEKPERNREQDHKGEVEGRDVPPARRRDPNSPWMGGG
jgi:hypothetical protein